MPELEITADRLYYGGVGYSWTQFGTDEVTGAGLGTNSGYAEAVWAFRFSTGFPQGIKEITSAEIKDIRRSSISTSPAYTGVRGHISTVAPSGVVSIATHFTPKPLVFSGTTVPAPTVDRGFVNASISNLNSSNFISAVGSANTWWLMLRNIQTTPLGDVFIIRDTAMYYPKLKIVYRAGSINTNVSGVWKEGEMWTNVNGVWKVGEMWTNVNGVWKQGQ